MAGAVGATGVATGLAAAETHAKAAKGTTPTGQVPSESTTVPSLAPSIGSNDDGGDSEATTTTSTTTPSYSGSFSTPSQPPTYSRHRRGATTSGGS